MDQADAGRPADAADDRDADHDSYGRRGAGPDAARDRDAACDADCDADFCGRWCRGWDAGADRSRHARGAGHARGRGGADRLGRAGGRGATAPGAVSRRAADVSRWPVVGSRWR